METEEYYGKIAKTYDATCYPNKAGFITGNEFRKRIVEGMLKNIEKGKVLDAGCGTGIMFPYLEKEGYSYDACDISEEMLIEARKASKKQEARIIKAPLDNLSDFNDEEFDIVLALGVFPYITPRTNQIPSYEEIWRVLRPNGVMITAHENELFDLYTFNKYTLRFFNENFRIGDELGGLLKYPKKPKNKDKRKSGRDFIITVPENPMTYPERLMELGFRSRETIFHTFHNKPPLLMTDEDRIFSSDMESRGMAYDWTMQFRHSSFVNLARKVMQ